jgi:multimeric flavodoxin WrbA
LYGTLQRKRCFLKNNYNKKDNEKDNHHRWRSAKEYEEIAQADGLVLGSPIYFGEVTGLMRAFLERLAFPWLSYNDYSLTAPKRMPVVLVETMNGMPERNNSNHFGSMEWCITTALGEPERIIGYNTTQVAKYDNYELGGFSEEAKHAWRDTHWEEDLQKAFEAGKRMAE